MKSQNNFTTQNKFIRPLLIIASIIFFFSAITFIIVFTDNFHTASYNKEIFYHYIKNESYAQLYEYACSSRFSGNNKTRSDADYAEIYAVADYYHASYLYHAHKDYDPELAKKYNSQMVQFAKNAGELQFAIESIDTYFEKYQ